MPLRWFDAHLDLAYLAVRGRDMTCAVSELAEGRVGPHGPAAVTLPDLRAAHVGLALGTIFTEPVSRPEIGSGVAGDTGGASLTAEQYAAGDVEQAHRRGRAQLEAYLTWRDAGLVSLNLRDALVAPEGVGEVRGGMGVAEVVPPTIESRVLRAAKSSPLTLGILIENADVVREPAELEWWSQRGVVAIGLAWAKPSRYAMGNGAPPESRAGLTDLGRAMVREMDRLDIAHDASHLCDRALDDLLELATGRVMASHSNCRALLDRAGSVPNQRHLTDRHIRAIIARGGVIGLNLFSPFLIAPGSSRGSGGDARATLEEAADHVLRICELAGDASHVGLGSDMDGGFSAQRLPMGMSGPKHLRLLADTLTKRGMNAADLECFAWKNWAEFFAGERKIHHRGTEDTERK
jgi:membrane dipeptidase